MPIIPFPTQLAHQLSFSPTQSTTPLSTHSRYSTVTTLPICQLSQLIPLLFTVSSTPHTPSTTVAFVHPNYPPLLPITLIHRVALTFYIMLLNVIHFKPPSGKITQQSFEILVYNIYVNSLHFVI